jgi:hypothetical protein
VLTLAPRLGKWNQQTLVVASIGSPVMVGVVIVACVVTRALLAPVAGVSFNARVFALVPDSMNGSRRRRVSR